MKKKLSLCIPTNGIIEWVFPVLDAIYNQDVDNELFEVIVTDNGNNEEFERLIKEYSKAHKNLVYKKTTAFEFLNQIEAFKLAQGDLIKFINHRSIMQTNSINYLLEFVNKYNETKPFVYFLNEAIRSNKKTIELNSFDEFVLNLSYYSSWSTGIAMWKNDFESISKDLIYNKYFPHTSMLFSQRKKDCYIIDNTVLVKDLVVDSTKKGRYNLFYDFAVEYPSILCDLYRSGDITLDTFLEIKKQLAKFLVDLYYEFIIKKEKCSYDLSNYKQLLNVYYSHKKIRCRAREKFIKRIITYPFRFLKRIIKKIMGKK